MNTKFRTLKAAAGSVNTPLLVIPTFEAESEGKAGIKSMLGSHNSLLGKQASLVGKACRLDKFSGKNEQTSVVITAEDAPSDRVMMVGLGKKSDFSADTLRDALVAAFKQAKSLKVEGVTMQTPSLDGTSVDSATFGRLVSETAALVGYVMNHKKTELGGHKPEVRISEVRVAGGDKALSKGLAEGATIAGFVNAARDMVNEPAGTMTPEIFAQRALAVAEASGGAIKVKLYRGAEIEKLGAKAFLAVAQGSTNKPVVVEMTYDPKGADPKVLLAMVGKTVTFDSGGLDIKSADGMLHMKCDMAGGAATMQAIGAIAELGLPVRVKAFMAATENMVSGTSYRPSDVIGSMGGLSIEIGNTDAEGRLTLADMVTLARKRGATHIVDLATLTGAIRVALGDYVAGAFTNDAALMAAVGKAAAASGELIHELPMHKAYAKQNDASMADLKNTGGAGAGSITAAWFIRKFADLGTPTPWVHLDIASVAFRDSEWGLFPKGGTGYGVRTLVELARNFAAKK